MSSSTFAVAGATGRLERYVVDVLTERGHQVVPMSRATSVDVITGAGLAEALTGVDVIIDVASWHASDREAATEFFRTATGNPCEAGRRAGADRIVAVSIIDADMATAGFLAAQQVHEEANLSGPLPARFPRAAQFHEFVGQLLDWQQATSPTSPPCLPSSWLAALWQKRWSTWPTTPMPRSRPSENRSPRSPAPQGAPVRGGRTYRCPPRHQGARDRQLRHA
ncbi:SDR family oxidoreductase [Streptomyces sp. NPDC054866]